MTIDEVLIQFEKEINELLEEGNNSKAKEAFDKITCNLYSAKSVFYVSEGNYEKAEEILISGIEQFTEDFDLHYNLAYLYHLVRRYDEAIEFFSKAKTFTCDNEIILEIDNLIDEIEHFHRNEPLVSVCMPIYNDEEHIEKAIKSVLNQTYQNFEIIICDNDSSDQTYKIVEKFEDVRIRLYKNNENIGFLLNSNKVWQKAKGKYIVTLHGDDAYQDTYIDSVVKIFNKNIKVGIIHFMQEEFKSIYFDGLTYFKAEKYYSKIFGCFMTPPPTQTAFRREALFKTNFYEKDYWTAEVRLMMGIASKGYDAYIEGQYLFDRYNGPEKDSSQIEKFVLRFEHLAQLFNDYKEDRNIKRSDFESFKKKLTDSFVLLFQNKDKNGEIEHAFNRDKEIILNNSEFSRVLIEHIFR